MFSPRWSTEHPPTTWAVFLWTPEKDMQLGEYVNDCIRVSLETSDEVDAELERAVYAARFPLGVNWKELAEQLHCTPMDCVRRYAELKTPHVLPSQEVHVVHSPRLEELMTSSLNSSPMLSPPPFALRSESRNSPFRWDEEHQIPPKAAAPPLLDDADALQDMEMEELQRDLSAVSTIDDAHPPLGTGSIICIHDSFL
ncbi:Aste57867_24846 [Aphanomyces stellatus]|uniref:Aste57867_24846 protein n=1 Tax=Aphanomyces stellatus TaxID=120398 RepID=A0A485LRL4_9STRA|nr:hypothetical protein As57867_024768 [Aphanomyces stellatus]VFU01480.1 Aste57867_24846 [Aphanomyces stellatus]